MGVYNAKLELSSLLQWAEDDFIKNITYRYLVNCEVRTVQKYLDEAKAYVIDKINSSNYPQGHPFLQESFGNDYILYVLAIIKCCIHTYKAIDRRLLDDYLCEKLRSNHNGVFDLESYYQNLNEVIFFYYLLIGLMKKRDLGSLDKIDYEPPGADSKMLEYSFSFNQNGSKQNVNFEIKTITCDPFLKDKNIRLKSDQKLIKKFFYNVDLTKCLSESELYDYTILENSTHIRQISKHVKKINGKFEKLKDSYNIGVIVIQFATSLEEFFAYLFHPTELKHNFTSRIKAGM